MIDLSIPFRSRYDVVIVGARCAGAATAMLLARRGLRVLAVDRSSYGTDALSTHALMRAGVVQLRRWGILPRVIAEGTPAIRFTSFHYGDREVVVPIRERNGVGALYAPRRTVIDRLLVDAAQDAGADVRHGVDVVDLVFGPYDRVMGVKLVDRQGQLVEVGANLVIGADGLRSRVARRVQAKVTRSSPHAAAVAFAYWVGLPQAGYQFHYRPGLAGGVIPTNGGESCVFVALPPEELSRWSRGDAGAHLEAAMHRLSPAVSASLAAGFRMGGVRAFGGAPGFLRQAHGSGWALVGDAGSFKDPTTAHGITDALRDAELVANAVTGGSLADYEAERDALSIPILDLSGEVASFGWDLDHVAALHEALHQAMKEEVAMLEDLDPVPSAAA